MQSLLKNNLDRVTYSFVYSNDSQFTEVSDSLLPNQYFDELTGLDELSMQSPLSDLSDPYIMENMHFNSDNSNNTVDEILSNNASPMGFIDRTQLLEWDLDKMLQSHPSETCIDESSKSSWSIGSNSPSRNEMPVNDSTITETSIATPHQAPLVQNNKYSKQEIIQSPRQQIPISPSTNNSSSKVPLKRIPIKPKSLFPVANTVSSNGNIVVIKNEIIKPAKVVPSQPTTKPNVMVFDSIKSIPLNAYTTSIITPVQSNQLINTYGNISTSNCGVGGGDGGGVGGSGFCPVSGMDPKLFKRQQRKIKNRESACLSRKKKKDYLNALEDQVRELSAERDQLIKENLELKQRLSNYEDNNIFFKNAPKPTAMCAVFVFLFVVVLNVGTINTRFSSKYSTVKDPSLANSEYTIGRNLLGVFSDSDDNHSLICPASINETESDRLLFDLKRWIDQPKKPIKQLNYPIKQKIQRRKKIYATRSDSSIVDMKKNNIPGPANQKQNEIDIFHPKYQQLYSDFFEAINRRDDTFYVVSFSEQHLLIPALYHNKTTRPKMSLLMASVLPENVTSNHTSVPLMQIDCEVLDTKSVNVKYGDIPQQYRQYNNISKPSDTKTSSTPAKKDFKYGTYKPYFFNKVVPNNDLN